jgi:rhodanese-related sulfurtransferase
MRLISREELKEKLDRGDDFYLLMTLGDFAFQAAHIPGSMNISRLEDALARVPKDGEVVVYCSNPMCPASPAAYRMLEQAGYTDIRRYAGGVNYWQDAGYELVSGDETPA